MGKFGRGKLGAKWLVFLIRPLYLIARWFVEDQRTHIIKTRVYKILDYVFKY